MNNVLHLVRKQGVPALAHSTSNVSRPWPCTVRMLYVEPGAQFTVSLESDVSIQGVDDKQLVALRFEGQNLVPGKGSLGRPVNIVLTAAMISRLARQGGNQVYVLSLVLKTPGAVWHPSTLSAEASGIDNLPHELSDLVRATEVCIVFDSHWLGHNLSQLQSAVEASQQLAGVPVASSSTLAQSHQRALWSVYEVANFVENETAAAAPPIEDAQDDAPPAYARKRPRYNRKSLTPDSPVPNRVQYFTRSVSPTERATRSSQGARSTTSSNATVVADVWQEAITKGLDKLLPELLPKLLPTILKDILADILPDILRATLPSLLAASRSPSPSQFPLHPSSSPANPPKISALISAHVETQLKSIFSAATEAAAESATYLADVALAETLDDHRVDLYTVKEDALAEMERIAHEQVDAFREEIDEVAQGVGEEVEKHAGEVVGRAYDVLDEVVGSKWVGDVLSLRIQEEQASLASESSGTV